MKHLGDITKISGYDAPTVNVIIGGSPCQDLSVAGKRAGLSGARSGLFMEQIRIIKEMRDKDARSGRTGVDIRPRFMVWENVPGALSVNKGRDFAAVLEETIRVAEPEAPDIPVPCKGWTTAGCYMGDGWSVAWRVLDAQYWGVPQRRRRIALVADFGGQSAPEILFKPKSVSGHFEPCGAQGQGTAGDAEEGSGASGGRSGAGDRTYALNPQGNSGVGVTEEKTLALVAQDHGNHPAVLHAAGFSTEHSAKARSIGYEEEIAPTLRAGVVPAALSLDNHPADARLTIREDGKCQTLCSRAGTGGNNVPLVAEPQIRAFGVCSKHSNSMLSDNPHSGCYVADTSRTLDNNGGNPACNQGGIAVVCLNDQGGSVMDVSHDVTGTIRAQEHGHQPIAVFENHAQDCRYDDVGNVAPTCVSRYGTGGGNTPLIVKAIGNGQTDNMAYSDIANTLDTMHDQQAAMITAVDCRNGTENETTNGTLQDKSNGGISYNLQNVCRTGYTVRRLTPLECERLQGFPSGFEVDVSKMTKDEYIAFNLASGNIIADAETGKVFATRGPGGKKLYEPIELKGTNVKGYHVVSIRNGQTKLQCRVHRIIWISQHGVIPDGYCIDHINNDKSDNRISNLQLLTPKQNSHKAHDDGLYKCGLDNKATKIDPAVKDEIAFIYAVSDLTQRQLAEMYGISKSRINQIVKEVGWTDIGEWVDSNGKKRITSDSARYKALGNSIAIPPWLWVCDQIGQYLGDDKTMASLFDGIGGFPLIWSYLFGKDNVLWASEIEEFPIAVTKVRFPDDKP